MSPDYKSNKKHIYKWRQKNAESFRIYNQNVYKWKKIQKNLLEHFIKLMDSLGKSNYFHFLMYL